MNLNLFLPEHTATHRQIQLESRHCQHRLSISTAASCGHVNSLRCELPCPTSILLRRDDQPRRSCYPRRPTFLHARMVLHRIRVMTQNSTAFAVDGSVRTALRSRGRPLSVSCPLQPTCAESVRRPARGARSNPRARQSVRARAAQSCRARAAASPSTAPAAERGCSRAK